MNDSERELAAITDCAITGAESRETLRHTFDTPTFKHYSSQNLAAPPPPPCFVPYLEILRDGLFQV